MRSSLLSRKAVAVALILGTSIVLALGAMADQPAKPKAPDHKQPPRAHKLSGPYTHGNLTIFLIHGDDQVKGKVPLTLDEALEQKKAVVHETKNVAEVSIENLSDQEIFLQSGDIVKGGQQDRSLQNDLLIPAKSGKVPVPSFCVEASRWSQRGGEDVKKFSSSKEGVSSKRLKVANQTAASQDEVWKNVAQEQAKLARTVGGSVKSAQSETSYQLTLEHKKVLAAVDGHVKNLAPIIENKKDVIGYAFAINGKVNSADVYYSNGLFKKQWPKMLKCAAVEAVAEMQKDKKFEPVTAEAFKKFLADAEKGKKTEKEASGRVLTTTRSEKAWIFESKSKDKAKAGEASPRKSAIAD